MLLLFSTPSIIVSRARESEGGGGAEMGNSNSGAGVNSGVGGFLLGVGVELELIF
jgi:hypothetical protein